MFWTYFWIGVLMTVSGGLTRAFAKVGEWWSICLALFFGLVGFAWVMTIWDDIDILARLGA